MFFFCIHSCFIIILFWTTIAWFYFSKALIVSFEILTTNYSHILNLINKLSLLCLKILQVNNCAHITPLPNTHTHTKVMEMELTALAVPCHYQFCSSLGRYFEYHKYLPPWPMNIQSFSSLYNWKGLLETLSISFPDLNFFNCYLLYHI